MATDPLRQLQGSRHATSPKIHLHVSSRPASRPVERVKGSFSILSPSPSLHLPASTICLSFFVLGQSAYFFIIASVFSSCLIQRHCQSELCYFSSLACFDSQIYILLAPSSTCHTSFPSTSTPTIYIIYLSSNLDITTAINHALSFWPGGCFAI